jgi:glycine cleavage system H lipoate-binding protein
MGKFAARLPGDRRYVRTHMWAQQVQPERWRFGFTAYAVRLMQDVYFLDWSVNKGDAVQQLQQIGHIETSKAVADLFAPIAGTLTQFNQELLKDPSAINADKYGAGRVLIGGTILYGLGLMTMAHAATPLMTPSNISLTKSRIYSTCLYLLAARSASIAARSRSLVSSPRARTGLRSSSPRPLR